MSDQLRQSDIGVNDGAFDEGAGARPDRRARIGFIGVGWWATTNHMPMLRAEHPIASFLLSAEAEYMTVQIVETDGGFKLANP